VALNQEAQVHLDSEINILQHLKANKSDAERRFIVDFKGMLATNTKETGDQGFHLVMKKYPVSMYQQLQQVQYYAGAGPHLSYLSAFKAHFNLQKCAPQVYLQSFLEFTLCECLALAKGVKTLHSLGVAHCDIKTENIMLDEYLTPKICDFGLASPLNDHRIKANSTDTMTGTPKYADPFKDLYMMLLVRKKDN
jgi:serine/threonine protein kinase